MSGAVEGVALLPCPWCGGPARWVEDTGMLNTPFGLVVEHSAACLSNNPMELDPATIGTLWNTRTTPPARSYADGVEDAAKVAEAQRVDADAKVIIAASIRLLSQGGKA